MPPADTGPTLAIVNARVRTGDPRRPWADAIAIAGDRLVAVGSSAEVKKLVTPDTRVVDGAGGMVMPADREKGMLRRGMPADVVLLDRDITRAAPEESRAARVMMEIVNGAVVFERE